MAVSPRSTCGRHPARCAGALLAFAVIACAHPALAGQDRAAACAAAAEDASAYRFQVGDVLDIQFQFTPEFNASPSVRPDGRIAMSGVPDLLAAGLTTAQLACAIERVYAAQLRDPVVSVSVRNFENPSFIVDGEIERPGKYDLRRETTLTQAIAIAGGFKKSASKRVYVFRRTASGGISEPLVVNVKRALEKGRMGQDVVLRRDDMVFVPASGFSKIERFIPIPGIGLLIPVP